MIDAKAVTNTQMKLVMQGMDAILLRHDEGEVERLFHRDFVQHNPWAQDGVAHVKEMCAFEFGVQMHRYVVQGDIAAYHGIYTAPNPLGDLPLLCVDLWRVQGGQIVEHWDALQPIPHDHVDAYLGGPGDGGAAVDPAVQATNAACVRRLMEGGAGAELLASEFAHHAPEPWDGASLLRWRDGRSLELRRTIASGDLVLAQLDVGGDPRQVAYAWFRVTQGKISDLWLVTQDFVAPGDAATPHPHF